MLIKNYETYVYKEYLQDKFLEYKKAKKTITNKDIISVRMEYIIYDKIYKQLKKEYEFNEPNYQYLNQI